MAEEWTRARYTSPATKLDVVTGWPEGYHGGGVDKGEVHLARNKSHQSLLRRAYTILCAAGFDRSNEILTATDTQFLTPNS